MPSAHRATASRSAEPTGLMVRSNQHVVPIEVPSLRVDEAIEAGINHFLLLVNEEDALVPNVRGGCRLRALHAPGSRADWEGILAEDVLVLFS